MENKHTSQQFRAVPYKRQHEITTLEILTQPRTQELSLGSSPEAKGEALGTKLKLGQGPDVDTARTSSGKVIHFCHHFSVIPSHYACKMRSDFPGIKLVPVIRRLEGKKNTNSPHALTSSIQLKNRSFHVVERTRTAAECTKMKNARAKVIVK